MGQKERFVPLSRKLLTELREYFRRATLDRLVPQSVSAYPEFDVASRGSAIESAWENLRPALESFLRMNSG